MTDRWLEAGGPLGEACRSVSLLRLRHVGGLYLLGGSVVLGRLQLLRRWVGPHGGVGAVGLRLGGAVFLFLLEQLVFEEAVESARPLLFGNGLDGGVRLEGVQERAGRAVLVSSCLISIGLVALDGDRLHCEEVLLRGMGSFRRSCQSGVGFAPLRRSDARVSNISLPLALVLILFVKIQFLLLSCVDDLDTGGILQV